jgi:hypothetical protein
MKNRITNKILFNLIHEKERVNWRYCSRHLHYQPDIKSYYKWNNRYLKYGIDSLRIVENHTTSDVRK